MNSLPVRKLAVDSTDIAILRELTKAGAGRFQSQRQSIEAVAGVVGMHPNTVFARVKRMEEAGWLLPFTVLPTPTVVGLAIGRLFVPMPLERRTDALLWKVLGLSCVFYVNDMLEGWEPGLIAEDDAALEVLAKKVVRLLGGTEVSWMIHATRDWPVMPHYELDEADLSILEALLEDPYAAMDELASRLGMNARTLQRRHERMREAGAFRIYPYGRGAMSTGVVLRQLQVTLPLAGMERSAAEAEIDRLLPNLFARGSLLHGAWYVIYGDDVGELQAQVERVASIVGVTVTSARHLRRFISNPDYPKQVLQILRSKQRAKKAVAPA